MISFLDNYLFYYYSRILCGQKKIYSSQKLELKKAVQEITQNLNEWKEEQMELLKV